ncbi:hypothetical protein IDJ75_08740 [Mucilaginibacter rigui]|uniref:DUF3192 domain-containing protein n=1 Tax=Mucilaginibacter rigui TaxID=534635 RepID=A0ABR7X448_9SPHI|nr:hypothetical protein [Mucilaginibacter rigui]MBD1385361.1 hypothetical protein [Mucilaginibacter rigui]
MLKKIKPLVLILFVSVIVNLCPYKTFAQTIIANTPKEKKVLTLISALPEVKKHVGEVTALSKGKTPVELRISGTPDINIPYYQVNVVDGPPTNVICYQFAVDPKTYQIFFYDAKKNQQYSLEEWRKMAAKN